MNHNPQHPLSWQFILGGVIIVVLGYIVTRLLFPPNNPTPPISTLPVVLNTLPAQTKVIATLLPGDQTNDPHTQNPDNNNCKPIIYELEGEGICSAIGSNRIELHALPQLKLRAFTEPRDLHDFSIAVTILLVQSGNNAQYGIVARKSDDCQFYLLLVIPAENKLELKKYLCEEGGYITLNSSSLPFNPSVEHNLKLEITGGNGVLIIVSANNHEIFTYTDNDNIIWRGDAGVIVGDAVVQSSYPEIIPSP